MKPIVLSEGTGRTKINLSVQWIGKDLIVSIHNEHGHLGAVAVADYCHEENRASTSVITRLGHKDDAIAVQAAYQLCKRTQKPICAIVGIHLDSITQEEISQITLNCEKLVEECSRQIEASGEKPD
jgi:hypothetical protein